MTLSYYLGTNVYFILAIVTSVVVCAQLWVLYYYRYIKDVGWFKPVAGKASFLASIGVLTILFFITISLFTSH